MVLGTNRPTKGMTLLNSEDRWTITQTVSLVSHLVDEGGIDHLGDVFTGDVVYDMSAVGVGVFEGIEVVKRGAQHLAQADDGPAVHFVTNIVITDETDDEATVRSRGLMLMRDGSTNAVTQVDTLIRQQNGWRISRRMITPLYVAAAK